MSRPTWLSECAHACVRACVRVYILSDGTSWTSPRTEPLLPCARVFESLRRRREGESSIIAALWRSRTVDVLSTSSAVRVQWPTLMD